MPLRAVFDAPTIAGQAITVDKRQMQELESGDLGQVLAGIENLTDEEANALLARQTAELK